MEKITVKVLQWLLITTFMLVVAVFAGLQVPYIQNYLFERLLQRLSHSTQFSMTHQHFQLQWLRHGSLTGLTIKDPQNNTLFAVDHLALELRPWQLLTNRCVALKNLGVKGAKVQLYKQAGKDYNLSLLLQRLAGNAAPKGNPSRAISFTIQKTFLQDIEFSIDNQQAIALPGEFDLNHLKVEQINAQLADLKVQKGTFEVAILQITGKHATLPLPVDHLSTSLVIASNTVACKHIHLQMGHSILKGDCIVTYDPSVKATAFINNLHFAATLDHTVLSCEELGVFAPYFKQHKSFYTLCGEFKGKLDDFQAKDFVLNFGKDNSYLKGNFNVQGLPQLQTALFDIKLERGVLHATDLFPYLKAHHHESITKLKRIKPWVHCHGRFNEFTLESTFDTNLGNFATNLTVRTDLALKDLSYKGTITANALELGALLDNDAVKQLTMQGKINGRGLALDKAYCALEADIDQLGLYDYQYKNIRTKGHLDQGVFQAEFTIDEPYLSLQANTKLDLASDKHNASLQGVVSKADLKQLHFTQGDTHLSTVFAIALQGPSLDNMQADAHFNELQLRLRDKQLKLDDLHLHLGQEEGATCVFNLDSAWCTIKAKGSFTYNALASSFWHLIQGYQQRLTHTVQKPLKHASQPCSLTYQIHCKDLNPLFQTFAAASYISPNMIIEGSFTHDQATNFTLHLHEAASLVFRTCQWNDTQFNLKVHQHQNSQKLLATAHLTSKTQQWGKLDDTENFSLLLNWNDEQLDFNGTFEQKSALTDFNLQGKALLLDDTIAITLSPSQFQLAGQQWHMHPDNRIVLGKAWSRFQNVELVSGEQKVKLTGTLSADPSKELHIQLKDFLASNLNPFVQLSLAGTLNATVALRGALSQATIKSDITVQNLAIDGFLVGDIYANTRWKDVLKQLDINGRLEHLQKQAIAIKGFYSPQNQEDSLQLVANFSQAPLAALQPLVQGAFSQLVGQLDGTLSIKGSPLDPQVIGQLNITNAATKVAYLNTAYHFNGELLCAKQAVHLTRLDLVDDQHGQATIQGVITYQGFKPPHFELTGNMTNFKLSDIALGDKVGFYGIGIASGELTASGPLNKLVVHAKVKTEPGTQALVLVRQSTNTIVQEGFVQFVNFETRSAEQEPEPASAALGSFQLTLMLAITPEAYTKIILNKGSGDMIKGKGRGNLKLIVDAEGNLSMAGNFEFLEGEYNFSLHRFVKKTFKILPGSQITWYDSPEKGILDLKAAYKQQVVLASLSQDNEVAKSANVSKKYPVQVTLTLQGLLLTPEINFQIQFLEYPNETALQTAIKAFQRRTEEDKSFLTQQVVSLVMLKRFFSSNTTNVGPGVVGGSVSELFSQQLSNLATTLDENLEVDADLDLNELGQSSTESLRVRLSYNFLEGRLRLTREGDFNINSRNETNARNLIGDLTVEYQLTKDGRLSAKLYNKNLTDPTDVDSNKATNLTGGFSLLYKKSFNQWKELFRRRKKTKPKATSKVNQKTPGDFKP